MKQILVTRSSMPDFEEYVEEIRPIWESHWLTNMGPKHAELADALREYLGVERIDLFTNGHMAIELTLQAMGLEGEVITTPFTFASTTHAIVRKIPQKPPSDTILSSGFSFSSKYNFS